MKVLHILQSVRGTTIPVEIASAVDAFSGIDVDIVSASPLPEHLPDTVQPGQIRRDVCGFERYGDVVSLARTEYDAIHTHKVGPAAKAGYHALRQGVTHINTQHGHVHYTLAERAKNVPGIALADAIVYNSNCTAESYNRMERFLKRRASEFIVHNGVDTERTRQFRPDFEDPSTIVSAARFIPRKNLGALIRALRYVDGGRLKLIGGGPIEDGLRDLAREAGVADRTSFLGYLPERRDVYDAFSKADVFALPSHGEGFGVSVAEAMAVGLPVVVSDIPVFHEVAGSAGVFVDPDSPEEIGDAIAGLLANPSEARRLGAANRERIHDHFSLSRCARGYRGVYRSVIRGEAGTATTR